MFSLTNMHKFIFFHILCVAPVYLNTIYLLKGLWWIMRYGTKLMVGYTECREFNELIQNQISISPCTAKRPEVASSARTMRQYGAKQDPQPRWSSSQKHDSDPSFEDSNPPLKFWYRSISTCTNISKMPSSAHLRSTKSHNKCTTLGSIAGRRKSALYTLYGVKKCILHPI